MRELTFPFLKFCIEALIQRYGGLVNQDDNLEPYNGEEISERGNFFHNYF